MDGLDRRYEDQFPGRCGDQSLDAGYVRVFTEARIRPDATREIAVYGNCPTASSRRASAS